MGEGLQAAKTGLCLRRVAPGGKGIEAAVFANGSQLLHQFVELLGLHGGSAPLGQRHDPDSHDLAAEPKRHDIARLDRMARLLDPHPIEAHPSGLCGGLRQRPRAIETSVKQPFVEPSLTHWVGLIVFVTRQGRQKASSG